MIKISISAQLKLLILKFSKNYSNYIILLKERPLKINYLYVGYRGWLLITVMKETGWRTTINRDGSSSFGSGLKPTYFCSFLIHPSCVFLGFGQLEFFHLELRHSRSRPDRFWWRMIEFVKSWNRMKMKRNGGSHPS